MKFLLQRRSDVATKRRRGSVLVLVMTLLGILFVVGVAFLATMNFEAGMISAETSRSRGEVGVKSVADDVGSLLRDGLMFNGSTPFGGAQGLSGVAYADLPGWHNATSPIEPYREDNNTPSLMTDDQVLFPWFVDVEAMKSRPFGGSTYAVPINTAQMPGAGSPVFVDADGDGTADSIQVDASALGLSPAQLAELSARLNPTSNPNGKVYVGVRIIPHTGLANVNQSHPTILQSALGLPYWPAAGEPPDPGLGNFVHRPTQFQVAYSSALDEVSLRHRNMIAPRLLSPSPLQGDPVGTGPGDMPWQLFSPLPGGGAALGQYESISAHRYWTYRHDEYFADNPDNPTMWQVRMNPASTAVVDPSLSEYDRRHLVTTVSYDDLLSRGTRVTTISTASTPPITITDDVLIRMIEANQSAFDPDNCVPPLRPGIVALPFEYADYPQTIATDCCPTVPGCKVNPRKGRLQLSLAWLDNAFSDDGNDANDAISRVVRDRLIYDAFFMLVNNAKGAYWEDITCTSDAQCPPYEQCRDITGVPPVGVCRDRVTNQRHRQNILTRTAAALTANLLDAADLECLGGTRDAETCRVDTDCPGGACLDRAIPTRVALRSFDFEHKVCYTNNGDQLIAPVAECDTTPCGPGFTCVPASKVAGREFDTDSNADNFTVTPPADNHFKPVYVYGIERQLYITEVATLAVEGAPGTPPVLQARAVEIFNPYNDPIDATGQYFLVEAPPGGTQPPIALNAMLQPNSGAAPQPFTVFASGDLGYVDQLAPPAPAHGTRQYMGAGTLQFQNGWRIYLIRRVRYPGETVDTDIVVDQFTVGGDNVGKEGPALGVPAGSCAPPGCAFSLQRNVQQASPWTAPVPHWIESPQDAQTLGTWNNNGDAATHPVEIQVANLGTFAQVFRNPGNPADPRNGSVSFPTTGSLLVLPRHANRGIGDLAWNLEELAFTTRLDDNTDVYTSAGALRATVFERDQIDNGRMPVFDRPVSDLTAPGAFVAAHHDVSPPVASGTGDPGDLNELPWGQLVFDYFTVLPLSNAGAYFENPAIATPGAPESQPKVDLEGLRVHGRVNINAAPATVLEGLPYVPVRRIPEAMKDRIRAALVIPPPPTMTDDGAWTLGPNLAEAIVAYRENAITRPVSGAQLSGNYNDGRPLVTPPGTPPVAFGRGLGMASPLVRRGTGFLSVGELANVRHLGAAALAPPPPPGFPTSLYRIDGGLVDDEIVNDDNNQENFVDAIAALYALGDWVTVRSQVFTVYGVLRGEEDPSITDPDPFEEAKLRVQDVDSRAIRFQETIDRLPTVLGQPLPARIGSRTVGRYSDVRND